MFKVVMEDLPAGEVAAIYQNGDDVLVMVSRDYSDDARCDALNKLYAQIAPPGPRTCPQPGQAQRLLYAI